MKGRVAALEALQTELQARRPENELLRVMHRAWPDQVVFLAMDDPAFSSRGVALIRHGKAGIPVCPSWYLHLHGAPRSGNLPITGGSAHTLRTVSDVTRLLDAVERGQPQAAEELLPLVYEELRRLAAAKMACQPPGQTLQATALVHEAWLRLVGAQPVSSWNSRGHFFAAAAEAMRRILVENVRRKQAQKRGAGAAKEELQEADLAVTAPPEEILDVHEALDLLAQTDSQAAELVKLRYFVGLTIPEAAESLNLSVRSAERLWTFARTWLHRQLDLPA